MGFPERVIARYEREAWVQPISEGGIDEYYRPMSSAASVAQIKLALIEDPTVLTKVDPGLVQAGSLLAYVRKAYGEYIQSKAHVWWDDEENSSGIRYEVQRIEDYRNGFGRLGDFMRLTLARIEV